MNHKGCEMQPLSIYCRKKNCVIALFFDKNMYNSKEWVHGLEMVFGLFCCGSVHASTG